jgi:hypothetical protein
MKIKRSGPPDANCTLSLTWEQLVEKAPAIAEKLADEYRGFSHGPGDCTFKAKMNGEGEPESLVGRDPQFSEPWVYDFNNGEWLS